jgi:hypothetical protein
MLSDARYPAGAEGEKARRLLLIASRNEDVFSVRICISFLLDVPLAS